MEEKEIREMKRRDERERVCRKVRETEVRGGGIERTQHEREREREKGEKAREGDG